MRGKVVGYGLVLVVVTLGAVVNWPEGDGSSMSDGPDRKRFEERAAKIVREWPDVRRTKEVDDGLSKVESMRWGWGKPPGRAVNKAERMPPPVAPASARSFVVMLTTGDCLKSYGTMVHESRRLVVVGGWSASTARECTKSALMGPEEVRLRAPLGDRVVVDAVTGERLRPAAMTGGPLPDRRERRR